jgi:hypothetical protein
VRQAHQFANLRVENAVWFAERNCLGHTTHRHSSNNSYADAPGQVVTYILPNLQRVPPLRLAIAATIEPRCIGSFLPA